MLTPDDLKQIAALFTEQDKRSEKRLEELEGRINRRFDAVDQRFQAMDKKFDGMERRFTAVDQQMAALDAKITSLDQKMDQMKDQIVQSVADYFDDTLLPLLDKFDQRLTKLEQHTTHPPGDPTKN